MFFNQKWDIILHPITHFNLDTFKEFFGPNNITICSRQIDTTVEGHIISSMFKGDLNMFEFLLGFEVPVWITLFISTLLIPLAIALIDKSFNGYFANLWNYAYVLLSE